MKKLAIVGDSSHDLTLEIGKKFGIEVVSYYLQMDNETYKDLVEITSKQFYEICDNYHRVLSASPPIQDVIDLLDRLKSEGYQDVLMICTSPHLTGMHNLYHSVENTYKGLNLHVYNTYNVGAGSGLISIYAAELRDQGIDVHEIIDRLTALRERTYTYALFRTLSYLIKGGRFNKYKGMIGNFLHINPLLYVEEGSIIVVDRIRGKKKSLKSLIEHVKKEVEDIHRYRMIIFAGGNEEEKITLREELKSIIESAELFFETELTPILGVHGGPKSIGVSILNLDAEGGVHV